MSDNAIKFENISKQYRLGKIGTGTLSHDLKRWWNVSVRGNEDPYLKIGSMNDRSAKVDSDYVWALRDINLEVAQGEVLGIIGKNGAGKSTLLKLLSRVTAPTTGVIKAKGRIASLLEVGTGFHPEMTGRENIYMNGSIMGMTKSEIARKFDEIVNFSGVEKYIDTPVKRYSSGMIVRLGFSIAAYLEPEILVVDEVLAVGDAEFQKKCLGKMEDVSAKEGRTVLFVSHNMDSILRLCKRCVLLENSKIKINDSSEKVINYYLEKNFGTLSNKIWEINESISEVRPLSIKVHDQDFIIKDNLSISERLGISFEYEILSETLKVKPGFKFTNQNNINIFDSHENTEGNNILKTKGKYLSILWIPQNFFNEGVILVSAALLRPDPLMVYFFEKDTIAFNIFDQGKNITRGEYTGPFPGIIRPFFNWQTKKININERI